MTLSPLDHTSLASKFPDSIYGPEPEEPIRILERAFAERDNDLEGYLIPYWDPSQVFGLSLDSIAKIVGIPRDGRTDEEFAAALVATPALAKHKLSIPELLELANIYGIARVESLWEGGDNLFYWSGEDYMSGLEPMSERYRAASLYWKIETAPSANFRSIRDVLDKARGVGVGLYYLFTHRVAAVDIAGPGGTGFISTPVSVDEVSLLFGGTEQARFSVTTDAGLCSFRLYETMARYVDTIVLYASSAEVGRFTVLNLVCDHRNKYVITLEGLNGA